MADKFQIMSLSACTDCPLHVNGFAVPGVGNYQAKYLFLGEAPGETEGFLGEPFVGAAGKQLNKLLELAELRREDIWITNSVKHHPGQGNPKPSVAMVRSCRKWLDMEIRAIDPDVIVCLGQTAAANILEPEYKVNMKRDHGKSFNKVILGRERRVHVAYHPAAGLHNPNLKPQIEADFRAVKGTAVRMLDELEVAWLHSISSGAEQRLTKYPVSIDLETTSLNVRNCNVVAVSWSQSPTRGYVSSPSKNIFEELASTFPTESTKIFHNSIFDVPILMRLAGISKWPKNVVDTMLTAYILGKELSLKTRALRELNIKMETFKDVGRGKKDASEIDPWRLFPYAAVDAVIPLMLWEKDIEEINSIGAREGLEIEHALTPIFAQMHKTGIKFDVERAERLSGELGVEMQKMECMVWASALRKINLNAPQDVAKLLFDELGVEPVHKTKGGQWSTDHETLKTRIKDHKVIPFIMEWKEFAKVKGTFVDGLVEKAKADDGYIHTEFKQYGARGGRTSSANPNLQNIPMKRGWGKKIRALFVPEEGNVFLEFDWSQLEMRVMAAMAQDPTMLRIFQDGEDLHNYNCRTILGREPGNPDDRRLAKNIGFGLAYGLSPTGLQTYLAIESEPPVYITYAEAAKLHRNYILQFPALNTQRESWKRMARGRGYVENLWHYRRYLPELESGDRKVIGDAMRIAVNLPVQGTAGVLNKKAMVELGDYQETFRNTVHDSILCEVRAGWQNIVAEDIISRMERLGEDILGVKCVIEAKTGINWGEMHELGK